MNQDFTVKKKQYLSEKKIHAEGFTWKKKNPAQAEGEKKNPCKLKIPHPPPPSPTPTPHPITFLMVRPLARYPQPDQRDIPV